MTFKNTGLVLSHVSETEVTTENPPRINRCSPPPSSIRAVESNVAMNVAGIGASDVNAAEISNRSNQYRARSV